MSLRLLKNYIRSKWGNDVPKTVRKHFNVLVKRGNKYISATDIHHVLGTKSRQIGGKSNTPAETQNNVNLLYGTIKDEAIARVLGSITLNESDVFYDLGSGIGNVCDYVFRNTKVQKCVGIEYDDDRFLESLHLCQKSGNRVVTFEHGNFLKKNWADGTVFFMDSIGYSDDTLAKIQQKIKESSPGFRYLLSMKKLKIHRNLRLLTKINNLPVSWGTSQCYVYVPISEQNS